MNSNSAEFDNDMANFNGSSKVERLRKEDDWPSTTVRNVSVCLLLFAFVTMMLVSAEMRAEYITASTEMGAFGTSSGRLYSLVAAVMSLTSVVLGRLAFSRPAGRLDAGSIQRRAILSLVAGLLGISLSSLHLVFSDGGVGTGNGRGGAIVALVLGVIGTALSGLALTRSRGDRTESQG